MESAPNTPRSDNRPQAGQLAQRVGEFFTLSSALSLNAAENQALLDLPAPTVMRLRSEPLEALQLDRIKLKRRLDYAIPIMRRMIASMAS